MRWLVLLVVLVLAGCGGGGTKTSVSGDPLGTAVRATLSQASEKVKAAATIDLSGQTLSFAGDGAFDNKKSKGELHVNFDLGLAGSSTLDEVFKDRVVWLHSPLLTIALHGKRWVKVDLAKQATALGVNLNVLTGQTPAFALGLLQTGGKGVTTLGTQSVGGVSTTHYRVDLGMTNQNTVYKSAEAWVGDDNLVRRIKLDYDVQVNPTSNQPAHTVLTMTLSDFGTAVDATPPPAADVIDASELSK